MNKKSWQKSIFTFVIVYLFFSCGGGGKNENNINQDGLSGRVLLTAKEALVLAEPIRNKELPTGVLILILGIFSKEQNFNGKHIGWIFIFRDPQTFTAIDVEADSVSQDILGGPYIEDNSFFGYMPEEWIDSDAAMEVVLANGGSSEDLCCGQIALSSYPVYPPDPPFGGNDSTVYAWLVQYFNDVVSISHVYYVGLDGKFLGKEFE